MNWPNRVLSPKLIPLRPTNSIRASRIWRAPTGFYGRAFGRTVTNPFTVSDARSIHTSVFHNSQFAVFAQLKPHSGLWDWLFGFELAQTRSWYVNGNSGISLTRIHPRVNCEGAYDTLYCFNLFIFLNNYYEFLSILKKLLHKKKNLKEDRKSFSFSPLKGLNPNIDLKIQP